MTGALALRLAIFAAALGACALAERARPRRKTTAPSGQRWLVNIELMLLGALAVRLLSPLSALEAAAHASSAGWGLLNALPLSPSVKTALSVLVLDMVVYWQHRAFHEIPMLWRLHAVHHTDLDLDAGSSVRFHPVELLVSMMIKIAAILALGASVQGVLLFEIILSTAALFHHSNIFLPAPVDGLLRLLTVTPDMHRVHHSPQPRETNSNYSFNLTCWDRLFGTYRDQPREPHERMPLGLADHREAASLNIGFLLTYPLRFKR
ncbi:MAG: sterol desaturase family protein [Elusimicrobiota bacterium]